MDYDIAIIGAGPGGYVAAIRAAQLGARVAVIEKDRLGGVCLNRGCIPTKALLAGVALKRELAKAPAFGFAAAELKIDYTVLAARKDATVGRLVQGIQFLFKKNKVELIQGRGSLAGPGRVAIELSEGKEEELSAKAIILAAGSEPALGKLSYNGSSIVTSNEALSWRAIPESVLIIGGGVIGCEFAVLYGALGASVTILEALPDILLPADREMARSMQGILKKQGIEIRTGVNITSLREERGRAIAGLEKGGEMEAEKALIAIGRSLNTEGLGLKEAGIGTGERGEVIINNYLQTSRSDVYAIGDLTGNIPLAHVASAQGIAAVHNILDRPTPMDYQGVPNCIFTVPEIAGVGLTSQEAVARNMKIRTGKFPFLASGKAVAGGDTEGMVKILTDGESGRILGVHILGTHATDLIAEAALAIRHNLTARQLADTIHAHPTLSEAVSEAAEAVEGRSIHY